MRKQPLDHAMARRRDFSIALGFCGLLFLLLPSASAGDDASSIAFRRDVQPLLAEFCLKCHGPDSEERQAGLRLDLRDEATKRLESGGRAIVPHAPGQS